MGNSFAKQDVLQGSPFMISQMGVPTGRMK
jgi:hypothetical protein